MKNFNAFIFLACACLLAHACGTAQHQGGREAEVSQTRTIIYPDGRKEIVECNAKIDSASAKYAGAKFSACGAEGSVDSAEQGRESSVSKSTGKVIEDSPKTFGTMIKEWLMFK